MNMEAIVFSLIGAFVILAGVFNWDWYMNSHKLSWLVRLVGRQRTRVVIVILGAVFIGIGALAEAGVINLGST